MLAYDVRDDYEIIEEVKIMSPNPNIRHSNIIVNLIGELYAYVKPNKLGTIFQDNMDVHLPDGNLFRPDFAFISAANKTFAKKIIGNISAKNFSGSNKKYVSKIVTNAAVEIGKITRGKKSFSKSAEIVSACKSSPS